MSILWQVDVHREDSWDSYRVLATDDIIARAKAIKRDEITNDGETGNIIYCEIELISRIDVG